MIRRIRIPMTNDLISTTRYKELHFNEQIRLYHESSQQDPLKVFNHYRRKRSVCSTMYLTLTIRITTNTKTSI